MRWSFLQRCLLALPLTLCWLSCGDDAATDSGGETLEDALVEAGLPPGNYRVDSGGNAVCSRVRQYPGGNPVTETYDLSGFQNFELRLVRENTAALRGTYDQLETRWDEAGCLIWDASSDPLTSHDSCGGTDPCTPFATVELCASDEGPTFFARIDECGQSLFPAVPQ